MPRTEMRQDVRERLLDAVLEALCESPQETVDPLPLATAAGIAAAEFEAEFGDAEGCLLAVSERVGQIFVDRTTAACVGEDSWPERVSRGLQGILAELSAQPALARVAMRSLPGRSRAAYARYQAMLEGFARLLREGRSFSAAGAELPDEVEMLAVGAAEAIIFEEIEAGRAAQLPALAPEILFSLLVPFLGPEGASVEMRRAAI